MADLTDFHHPLSKEKYKLFLLKVERWGEGGGKELE